MTWRKFTVEPHILGFADFRRWEGAAVLDLGCGIGTMGLAFADAGARHVDMVDASQRALDITAFRLRHHPSRSYYRQVRLHKTEQDDIRDLIAADALALGWYDLVFCFGVLHHTPRPAALLASAHELLRIGGELRVMVYHKHAIKALWVLLKYGRKYFLTHRTLRGLLQHYSEAQEGCPIARTYSRREIVALLEASGFLVDSVEVDHIFPYNIDAYKDGALVREWYWQVLPRFVFRALERMFGWHLLVKARKV